MLKKKKTGCTVCKISETLEGAVVYLLTQHDSSEQLIIC